MVQLLAILGTLSNSRDQYSVVAVHQHRRQMTKVAEEAGKEAPDLPPADPVKD